MAMIGIAIGPARARRGPQPNLPTLTLCSVGDPGIMALGWMGGTLGRPGNDASTRWHRTGRWTLNMHTVIYPASGSSVPGPRLRDTLSLKQRKYILPLCVVRIVVDYRCATIDVVVVYPLASLRSRASKLR